jgi:hypothetical protein
MAVVWPFARGCSEVNLVEMVDDAVYRIKHRAIRVVLTAAVLVHEVERRRGFWCEGLAAELSARSAGPEDAAGVNAGSYTFALQCLRHDTIGGAPHKARRGGRGARQARDVARRLGALVLVRAGWAERLARMLRARLAGDVAAGRARRDSASAGSDSHHQCQHREPRCCYAALLSSPHGIYYL